MIKTSSLFALLFLSTLLFAQEDSTATGPWTASGVTGLNVSQIAFSNWSQGGENSLTWTIYGDFDFVYTKNPWVFSNELKVAYGRTKLGDQEVRINDNEFYNESVLTYELGWAVSPFVSNTIVTVIDKGYDYEQTPKVEIARFFDPGYITQSFGFTYHKKEIFKTRLGIAFQETFTSQNTKYTDDPETVEIEDFKFETGIESVSETKLNIDSNVLLKSKLRLFGRFEEIDVWDVRWDNSLVASINDYMNVNLGVLVIYEKAQSIKTQVKQTLQLGITYKLF
ncbi:MAG: hypothetical protein SCALA702_10860 [Melioribacteraceae bacterium]|nr:MAG: hypothetical protein SCALA702_10860 [Melioribacteraceae bacterium]